MVDLKQGNDVSKLLKDLRNSLGLVVARAIALLVVLHGLGLIASTLVGQLSLHIRSFAFPSLRLHVDLTLLLGLALVYVSLSLARRKYTAWLFTFFLYALILGLSLERYIRSLAAHEWRAVFAGAMVAPVMLLLLWAARKEFVVRSDIRTFTHSLRISSLVVGAALLYGVVGYTLMDTRDFHQEISLPQAVQYTIDQFELTTGPLRVYSKRAAVFQDSLAFISVSALGFAFLSLFQPIKARYAHRAEDHGHMSELVNGAQADSEDFFKLWPKDKSYINSPNGKAGIAYKAQSGVALAVGAPVGETGSLHAAQRAFEESCFVNDWRPAFIHITEEWCGKLKSCNYRTQLIGQEAVVDTERFTKHTVHEKYFREISKRFKRLGFTTELLQPPHHAAVIDRLQVISTEWLRRPGRMERAFMMGYFSAEYMQQCRLLIVRDAASTIQGFVNLVPSPVQHEANIDFLRSSGRAPGNINDYLLMELIALLQSQGIYRLNLGLSPLAGIDDEPSTFANRLLRFAYANGDRLYSFRGLHRFKAKYQPGWRNRYIAYKGTATDFAVVMRALNKAFRV